VNRRRALVVQAVLVIAAVAVLGRSAQVCVIDHDRWTARAFEQQEKAIEVQGPRGRILSSDGYVLATSTRRWAVQVDRKQLLYPKLFAAAAAPLLGENITDILARIEHGPRYQWLAKNLDRETAREVQELDRGAVGIVRHWDRVYPLGRIAAPLVGFVGREELRLEGRAGLERYYEHLLVGEPDRCLFVKDARGRRLHLERIHRGRAGYDLELTLDARLQRAAEEALLKTLESSGATRGSVVVLEADTGNLLALASAPLSNRPSTGAGYDEECWCLRPVQAALEPGSTIKPFVAAAGLASGAVSPGERFDCRRRGIRVGRTWIGDHADPGIYTLDEVITHSSNAGIIMLAERLDEHFLWKTLSTLGFGRRPELGFPSETSGLLWPVDRWSKLSRAGLSLGQEMTVSPLQLALAYATFANGGWLPEPRLVDRMRGRDLSTRDRNRPRVRVMDSRLAHRVTEMLESVVLQGTGTRAQVPGYRVAGKTGTAQVVSGDGFDDTHHAAWFAGFLPLPDPRWVIVTTIENPTKDYWASSVAAPLFASVARATVESAGLPPMSPPTTGLEAHLETPSNSLPEDGVPCA